MGGWGGHRNSLGSTEPHSTLPGPGERVCLVGCGFACGWPVRACESVCEACLLSACVCLCVGSTLQGCGGPSALGGGRWVSVCPRFREQAACG